MRTRTPFCGHAKQRNPFQLPVSRDDILPAILGVSFAALILYVAWCAVEAL